MRCNEDGEGVVQFKDKAVELVAQTSCRFQCVFLFLIPLIFSWPSFFSLPFFFVLFLFSSPMPHPSSPSHTISRAYPVLASLKNHGHSFCTAPNYYGSHFLFCLPLHYCTRTRKKTKSKSDPQPKKNPKKKYNDPHRHRQTKLRPYLCLVLDE